MKNYLLLALFWIASTSQAQTLNQLNSECVSGSSNSCFLLAQRFFKGDKVKQDKPKAVELYAKSCSLNNDTACSTLALIYDEGDGVAKDPFKSTELVIKSCEIGNLLACYIEHLHHGYKKNWCNLSKFEMPTSTLINTQIWNRARNAGWWQRRVYDLALVMYFEFVAKNKPIKLSKYVKQQFSTMPYTHI